MQVTALPLVQRQKDQEDFVDILSSTAKDIPDAFFTYLDESDFFSAPASTKFHDAQEGGLVHHSLCVYETLATLNYQYLLGFSDSTVAKTALLHDICKVGFYRRTMKNTKMTDGRWVKTEVWEIKDGLPLGHGEKSVIVLLSHGVPLTEEEQLAIRWHMGGFDDTARSFAGSQALSSAMGISKLPTALHIADMMSVWLNGAQGRE